MPENDISKVPTYEPIKGDPTGFPNAADKSKLAAVAAFVRARLIAHHVTPEFADYVLWQFHFYTPVKYLQPSCQLKKTQRSHWFDAQWRSQSRALSEVSFETLSRFKQLPVSPISVTRQKFDDWNTRYGRSFDIVQAGNFDYFHCPPFESIVSRPILVNPEPGFRSYEECKRFSDRLNYLAMARFASPYYNLDLFMIHIFSLEKLSLINPSGINLNDSDQWNRLYYNNVKTGQLSFLDYICKSIP